MCGCVCVCVCVCEGCFDICVGVLVIQGGADKSLARPNSRCRRTETIVSLERGVCSCAICKSFLVMEAEKRHAR